MSLTTKIPDGSRLKGNITSWDVDENEKGNMQLTFIVAVKSMAPPDTYEDEDFKEVAEPLKVRVNRFVTESGDNKWAFSDLEKLAGKEDWQLHLFDVEEEGAYDLTGKEVTLYAKHSEYNGNTRVNFNFNWPKTKRKVKPSKFADQLQAWREEKASKQQEESTAF